MPVLLSQDLSNSVVANSGKQSRLLPSRGKWAKAVCRQLQRPTLRVQASAVFAERLDMPKAICGRKSTPWGHTQSVVPVAQAAAKFAERLDTGHEASCPWLGNACDASVAQFPPLARPPVLAGFQERLAALGRLDALPPIAPAAYAAIERSHRRLVFLATPLPLPQH